MKSRIFALVCALLLALSACAKSDSPVVDYAVPDAPFVNSMLKLAVHYADYEGKVVSVIGFVELGEAEGAPFFVGREYRCCGADTTPYGFLCVYEGTPPEDGAWVEAAGTLTKIEDESGIAVLALEVIEIRPAEEGERVVTS